MSQDIEIAVITLVDKADTSPVHMVSEKWMEMQREISAASRDVMECFQALLVASDRLRELLKKCEEKERRSD